MGVTNDKKELVVKVGGSAIDDGVTPTPTPSPAAVDALLPVATEMLAAARQNLLLDKGHDIKVYLLFHAMPNSIILKEVMIP